jgi:Fe-S-cluster-containing dehydrogenase component
VVADLQASMGSSIVLAGEQQSPAVHALAHALNAALGNVGSTVFYSDPVEVTGPDGPADLSALVEAINSGTVRLLVVLGSNPVYSAPADLRFAEVYGQVPLRVHLGLYHDETAVLSNWHIPEAHFLEAWGDVRAFDGSASIVQPLIDPLYSGRTTAELLSALGGNVLNSYDLVRETWEPAVDETAFEPFWKTSLASGMIADTALPARAVTLQAGAVAGTTAASEGLELCLRPDPTIWDGRWANNGWLQELHKPITTLTWDNAALVSPRTAERLGVQNEDLVELRYRETVLEAPIWIMPGQADDVVTVTLGYGRTRAGNVGTGLGVNGYLLRYSDALWYGGGLELVPTGRSYPLASTQTHWSMEGRHIVQAATFEEYQQDPHFAGPEEDLEGEHSLLPEYEYPVRWAMSINLTTCIGCNACTIACQAENNIPIVGKDEVRNSRELHWIRVDRYYTGSLDNPRIYHMPVPCMHCEKAPCEIVCPVAATVHDQEGGLNQMVYNRCVGTKYCSNNCPYKVRRFNFYEYSDSPHETIWMQRNPDVTVRARGVMEKCTYCVQRINRTRINARREQRLIGEDEFTTACAQVCPTEAIVFGDMAQPSWRISRLKQSPLNYGLLGELNTQPRTSYQAKVTNPTPALAVEARRITEARNATEATERDGTATP